MSITLTGRAALLISEMQRGVIEAGGTFNALAGQVAERGITPRIADLANAFRAAGLPVIHLPATHRPDFADAPANTLIAALARKHKQMVLGTEAVEFVDELQPVEGDFSIPRTAGMVPFHGTTLDLTLRRMKIETVVLTGVSTNLAIPGAAIAGSDLGYNIVVVEDCIAGSDADTHRVIVENQLRMVARIASANEVKAAIAS